MPSSPENVAGTAERPQNEGDLVVVVEDDPRQRLVFQRWLERAGYRVEAFDDGESCIVGRRST